MKTSRQRKGLTRYQARLDRNLRRVERRLLKAQQRELSSDLDALGELAAKVFNSRSHLLDLDLDNLDAKSLGRKTRDEDNAAKIVASMDVDDWAKKYLKKTLERSAKRAFGQVRDTVDDTLRVSLDPPATLERKVIGDLGTRQGLTDIGSDTQSAIRRAIGQGRKESMTVSEIGDLIKREVPKGRFVNAGKKYRAEMIARTETRFAVNKSSMELYRNANEISAVVAIDGEDDDECAERNGEQFTFDAAEDEDAKTHPNCTLRWVPVVAGE